MDRFKIYKGRVGLKPIGPIAPHWAPCLRGPVLELSTLIYSSSTHKNTLQREQSCTSSGWHCTKVYISMSFKSQVE